MAMSMMRLSNWNGMMLRKAKAGMTMIREAISVLMKRRVAPFTLMPKFLRRAIKYITIWIT